MACCGNQGMMSGGPCGGGMMSGGPCGGGMGGLTSPGQMGCMPGCAGQMGPGAVSMGGPGPQMGPGMWLGSPGPAMGPVLGGSQSVQMGAGPYDPGPGCGGRNIPCGPQGANIPKSARARKVRAPSSTVPKRKLGPTYTTLVTPLAGAKKVTDDIQDKDAPPDHERFDTLTLAFGTKPGTDKPPKLLMTLKSPKVIAARLNTSSLGTQVGYRDLGLPDPTTKGEDAKSRGSAKSRRSRKSGGRKSKGSKSKKSVKSVASKTTRKTTVTKTKKTKK